jgi:hypothetical protein
MPDPRLTAQEQHAQIKRRLKESTAVSGPVEPTVRPLDSPRTPSTVPNAPAAVRPQRSLTPTPHAGAAPSSPRGSKVVGQVYGATSLRRRCRCNVGATTIDLGHRISVFENRCRLGLSVEFRAQTLDPFGVKHRVVSELARYRVAACTFQESNGWYAVSADTVRQAIERHRVRG